MREICTSGTARGEEGNRLTYSTAPSQRNGADFPFQLIGIDGHIGVGQKHFERGFALQRIPRGLGERIRREEHLRAHRLFEPGKEILHQRFGHLPPVRELGVGL
jgi:hypothetical protein